MISTRSRLRSGSPPVNPIQKTPRAFSSSIAFQDRRRVQRVTAAVPVVAVGASLGAGVGHADLGMGRAVPARQEMLVDEPAVSPAVERRQMGMDDDVTAVLRILNLRR